MSETTHVETIATERDREAVSQQRHQDQPAPASGPSSDAGPPSTGTEPDEIPLDVVFDILKNQRRRQVLAYLREHESSSLSELAEHVAALENDKPVERLTSSERKRVYVGLYQCHLPRMDDAGVIDFDSDRGRIDLRASAQQLVPFLDGHPEPRPPRSLEYPALAIGGGVLYGASAAVFGPDAMFTILVVPLFVLAIVARAVLGSR